MGATLRQDVINIREELNSVPKRIEQILPAQWFIGDGVETDFPVMGEPVQVFNAGGLVKEGAGDEFVFEEGIVKFAVAPALNNDIGVFAKVVK